MLKVILADDEKIIREGLRAEINWEEAGFSIEGYAKDGIEALGLVREVRPDLVITDIRMPFLSGLEFIQKVKEIKVDLLFIIISGHDEFEYAQEALKLGVSDFLVKPVEETELLAALEKVKEKLAVREEQNQKVSKLEKTINFQQSLIREKKLYDLIFRGKAPVQEGTGLWADFENKLSVLLLVQLDNYLLIDKEYDSSKTESKLQDFSRLVEKLLSGKDGGYYIHSRDNEALILISASSPGFLKQSISDFCSKLKNNPDDNTYTLGISSVFEDIASAVNCYRQAVEAINRKFLYGGDSIYKFESREKPEKDSVLQGAFNSAALLKSLKTGSQEELSKEILYLQKDISGKGQSGLEYAGLQVSTLFSETLQIIRESGGRIDEIFDIPFSEYRQIMSSQTIEMMMSHFKKYLLVIKEYISVKRAGKQDLMMKKISIYMKEHYADTKMDLTKVASEFYLSSGYLCALFKPYLGASFKSYLTEIRMDKARDLIAISDKKVYEIGLSVGYDNPTYFSTLFKKHTGMSPGDFKKSLSAGKS